MKKIFALLLAVCVLMSICGCRKQPALTQESTGTTTLPTETTMPTEETVPVVSQAPMVSVALPAIKESAVAEDMTPIFSYEYQNMQLTVPDPEIADKVIVDFLTRMDDAAKAAEEIHDKAKTAYKSPEGWNAYLYRVSYDTMRIDHGILSLFGSATSYTGTPHPEHECLSVTYDLVTGNVLPLNGALAENASVDQLCQYVIEALSAVKDEKYLYEDFGKTVKSRISGDLSGVYNWYFSQTGLCIYFAQYEIAPYASGIITAEVPYSKLVGIIDDAYFPPERVAVDGTVLVAMFDDSALEKFSQFAEVVVDYEGDTVLLYTDGTVYDIRLETGSFPYVGAAFVPDHTVFAALSLTPGDAIMVQTDLTQRLRLTYQSGNETVSLFITQGQQAGTVQLTP